MLKINKKVEYALIALKLMLEKEQGELTTAREVSDKFHTPFDTTAKVMQMMNSARMLESVKGVKGGYYYQYNDTYDNQQDKVLLLAEDRQQNLLQVRGF